MKRYYTENFLRLIAKTPTRVQKAFDKQSQLLVENIRHPSLHAKKYDETTGLWQARASKGWRFYFTIDGAIYHLVNIEKYKD